MFKIVICPCQLTRHPRPDRPNSAAQLWWLFHSRSPTSGKWIWQDSTPGSILQYRESLSWSVRDENSSPVHFTRPLGRRPDPPA